MIIGVTGYVGVGKTTVCKIFEEKGFEVIDVDKIGHELLKNLEIKQKILAKFGNNVLDRKLGVDKKKLAEVVFSDGEKLKELNKITQKTLGKNVVEIIENKKDRNIVVDAALLNELELEKYCCIIILVKAEIEKIYERMNRYYSKRQVLNIMNNQKTPDRYDYTVENNGSIDELKAKVGNILKNVNC